MKNDYLCTVSHNQAVGLQSESVAQHVLSLLMDSTCPMDLDQLIASVRHIDKHVRSVDVKIAALNLVSNGCANLNDAWQISANH